MQWLAWGFDADLPPLARPLRFPVEDEVDGFGFATEFLSRDGNEGADCEYGMCCRRTARGVDMPSLPPSSSSNEGIIGGGDSDLGERKDARMSLAPPSSSSSCVMSRRSSKHASRPPPLPPPTRRSSSERDRGRTATGGRACELSPEGVLCEAFIGAGPPRELWYDEL